MSIIYPWTLALSYIELLKIERELEKIIPSAVYIRTLKTGFRKKKTPKNETRNKLKLMIKILNFHLS